MFVAAASDWASALWNSFMSRMTGFSARAMAFDVSTAMAVWSPVTIFTRTPMARAFSSVSLVSWRGGSKSASTPAKT